MRLKVTFVQFLIFGFEMLMVLNEHSCGSVYKVRVTSRNTADIASRIVVNSLTECAVRCKIRHFCKSANYINGPLQHAKPLCELISQSANNFQLILDQDSTYLYISECVDGACGNDGDCSDGGTGITCHCATGYEGDRCEIESNECASDPCRHGGLCTDALNGYTCHCVLGYEGENCETDLCFVAPCWDENNRWLTWRGNEYYFSPESCDHTTAIGRCSNLNATLLILTSDEELTLISLIAGDGYWIGLTRPEPCSLGIGCSTGTAEQCASVRSLWRWLDGSTALIQNDTYWETGKPDCVSYRATVRFLGGDAKWRTDGSYHNFRYICKRPIN